MTDDRQERIRRRAHEIWEQAGRPEGAHMEHWDQAAAEIDGAAKPKAKAAPKKAAKAKAPAKAPAKAASKAPSKAKPAAKPKAKG
ncbi:DUF2934 domain-containing protein [Mesorhizobium sp.]|uniref:DUF2934 domain-containing protein n=1 Tax=Mesorhizobium sp. TaxID=1871066 RepID=UPI000FE35C80|nr:DUF2934 domain-containing protein [Mesorhizobium sp.]RWA65429.1 MAG: DUF2934 domain-containing protein [Mesorhizobium sp.]RWB95336.1 MAG: DUF2934 domain-containing protein [Mesorhizobium sp.]RWG79262.1 MAG: DUF2934 domain-containing protein [Mesorhizobium sp.]RWG83569.1 MAG: DUF2934 domain-containing protein [Mesorhizobium sp.]RWK11548.1 MAG: DUF2934 domain-containing protein [Mesorhizobium sp.]